MNSIVTVFFSLLQDCCQGHFEEASHEALP
jgi:hypothetical protein